MALVYPPPQPTRSAAPGTIIEPLPGRLLYLHMDGLRRRTNRRTGQQLPLVRIVRAPDETYHVRKVELGRCWLEEDYSLPLPDRPEAVCVLRTDQPVLVLE